jgi:hypothetical protein
MPTPHRVRRIEFAEIAAQLPDIEPLEPEHLRDGALYICALGFEPRCLTVSAALADAGRRFDHCIVLEYDTNRAENELNRPHLMRLLSRLSNSIRRIEVDVIDFIDRLRGELRAIAAANAREPTIMLDVSVLANRALFRSLKPLLEANISLTILYSEAAVYHPTEETYRKNADQWTSDSLLGLEQGVSDIRISRDFPGQQLEALPDSVVVFPSFNGSRTNAVLAKVDPALVINPSDNVIWLVGVPHLAEDHWRIDAMKKINNINDNQTWFQVSTFSYKETFQILHNIYRERSAQFNLSISPLGSKLQALGCVLFCFQHLDVRVIYSIPSQYNAMRYSDGCKALWQIKFGGTAQLRSLINSAGKLRMERIEPP